MIDNALVQRWAMLARETYRLLSLIRIAFFIKTVLASGATLSLEGTSSLFVRMQRLPAHLAIKCATPQLTWVKVVRIQRCKTFSKEVILLITKLSVSSLDLTELLVPSRLHRRANCCVRVAIMPVIVQKSLTDVFECSGIIGLLGGFVKHGVIF
jgi:hypothetical protein